MALTDAEIQALKVPYGKNQFKVSDGGGLFLLVKSSGQYWKLAYRFDGKQKTLAFGVYPSVTIEDAREKRDAAKNLLAQGIDPGEIRKQEKMQQRETTTATTQRTQAPSADSGRNRRLAQLAAIDTAEQEKNEQRRLVMLQILAASRTYASDEAGLHAKLEAEGITISYDRLRADMAWLYEMQLIQLETASLWTAHLTQAGFDAAKGRAWVPGIKRPAVDESDGGD